MNKGKYLELKAKFGENKRIAKWCTATKRAKLTWKHILAYSTLVYRDPEDKGFTQRKLALLTHLHRIKTLPRLLKELAENGLAVKQEGLWHGQEPQENIRDWFSFNTKGNNWRKQLNYGYMVFPDEGCPFTVLECAILVQLLEGVYVKWIAARLRTSRKSVLRVRKKLDALGGRLENAWFEDKGPVKKKKAAAGPSLTAQCLPFLDASQLKIAEYKTRIMREAGYRERQIQEIWMAARKKYGQNSEAWDNFLWEFDAKFAKMEGRHKSRQKEGTSDYNTSFELFKHSLSKQ
jgi:hypothetical protein